MSLAVKKKKTVVQCGQERSSGEEVTNEFLVTFLTFW